MKNPSEQSYYSEEAVFDKLDDVADQEAAPGELEAAIGLVEKEKAAARFAEDVWELYAKYAVISE